MLVAFTKWVLALMLLVQPKAPWSATYEKTAEAIARVSLDKPLFAGKSGPAETAVVLVATAWFESTFKPDAVGDQGRSFCLFQIERTNHKQLGVTKEQLLADPYACTLAAREMMRISFNVCKGRPREELLGHYASGGDSCAGLAASRNRMLKAKWMLAKMPAPADADVTAAR